MDKIEKFKNTGFNTGAGTAALREIETQSNEPLIVDVQATHFANKQGHDWVQSLNEETKELMIDLLAVRTKVIDGFCEAFIKNKLTAESLTNLYSKKSEAIEDVVKLNESSTDRQIVVLGAGFDTRVFRLQNLQTVSFFEVDISEVISLKNEIITRNEMAHNCKVHSLIGHDLVNGDIEDVLTNHGFSKLKPTLWILEAISGYLPEDINRKIVKQITSLSAKNSALIATYVGTSKLAYGNANGKSNRHVFYTDSGADLFREEKWTANQEQIGDIAKIFGRDTFLKTYDYWIVSATLA